MNHHSNDRHSSHHGVVAVDRSHAVWGADVVHAVVGHTFQSVLLARNKAFGVVGIFSLKYSLKSTLVLFVLV